ncbi:hypothetical protein QQP08_000203 [Theobroma cacao]|nr:hypothetical protein QQP08_000203 [Theobroma cacao]
MEQLPQEIILRILFSLLVTSLLQSMLQSLIQDQHLVSKHFSHMVEKGQSFIFQSNWPESSYQLYFIDFSNDGEGKVILKKLPNFPMPMYLVDSCNGLLCMHDSRGIYICNPFTGLYLELPKLVNYPAKVGHIGFSFHQATNEYKVVRIVFQRQLSRKGGTNVASSTLIQSQVHVLTVGDLAWRNLGMIPYNFTQPTPNATSNFRRCLHNLMVLQGCLSTSAYHDNKQLEVWVMKEYGVKESWIKEFTIGTYFPQTLQPDDLFHYNNTMACFPNSYVKVLCILKNGEILLEYKNQVLILYDFHHGTFEELTFPKKPHWFKIIVHVGCLNWVDTPI